MTSDKANNHPVRKILGYILPVLFTAVFLILAFKGVDLGKSFDLISRTSILFLIVYIIVFFLSHYIRALRWKVIINSVKPDTSTLNLMGALMIGYGVNCVVPRLGEVYRGLFLGKWEGLSRTSMLGTVIVERIIDIVLLAAASFISAYIYSGNLYQEISWLRASLVVGFGFILLTSIALFIMIKNKEKFNRLISAVVGRFSQKYAATFVSLFDTLLEGLSSIRGVRNTLYVIFYSLLIYLLYAANAYVGFYMLGMQNIKEINFAMAWVLMTISAYGIVFPTPGGTGSYHIISIFVLSNLYGFHYETSAAYALLTHFVAYVAFIFSSLIFYYIINENRFRKGIPKENFLSVLRNKAE